MSMVEGLERLDGEGNKPYEAYVEYAQLGHDRTLAEVARRLGKSATMVERWSSKWGWKERIARYDESLARAAAEASEEVVKAMARRHAQEGMFLQEQSLREIRRRADAGMLDGVPFRDLVSALKVGTEMERYARLTNTATASTGGMALPIFTGEDQLE